MTEQLSERRERRNGPGAAGGNSAVPAGSGRSAAEGRLTVSFERIGDCDQVPDLVVSAAPSPGDRELRRSVRAYVASFLGTEVFAIALRGDEGFVDLGTHNGGLFRIKGREPAPAAAAARAAAMRQHPSAFRRTGWQQDAARSSGGLWA